MATDDKLRSKRELIQKFIDRNIPKIYDSEVVAEEFDTFWNAEREAALGKIMQEENLIPEKLQKLIDDYIFTSRKPRREELVNTLTEQPKVLERDSIVKRLNQKITNFIETFIEGK